MIRVAHRVIHVVIVTGYWEKKGSVSFSNGLTYDLIGTESLYKIQDAVIG